MWTIGSLVSCAVLPQVGHLIIYLTSWHYYSTDYGKTQDGKLHKVSGFKNCVLVQNDELWALSNENAQLEKAQKATPCDLGWLIRPLYFYTQSFRCRIILLATQAQIQDGTGHWNGADRLNPLEALVFKH